MCKAAELNPTERLYWRVLTEELPVQVETQFCDSARLLERGRLIMVGLCVVESSGRTYLGAAAVCAESEYRK